MGLHSLADRITFATLGEWEVRRHPEAAAMHGYFASRGLLHLQLWHPIASVSILTPSRLTHDRFEVWRGGVRISVRWWEEVVEVIPDLPLPGTSEITALCNWTVVRDAVRATSPVRRAGG